jgi:hypothetical protein
LRKRFPADPSVFEEDEEVESGASGGRRVGLWPAVRHSGTPSTGSTGMAVYSIEWNSVTDDRWHAVSTTSFVTAKALNDALKEHRKLFGVRHITVRFAGGTGKKGRKVDLAVFRPEPV